MFHTDKTLAGPSPQIATGRTLCYSVGVTLGLKFEVSTPIDFDRMESFRVHASRNKHNFFTLFVVQSLKKAVGFNLSHKRSLYGLTTARHAYAYTTRCPVSVILFIRHILYTIFG